MTNSKHEHEHEHEDEEPLSRMAITITHLHNAESQGDHDMHQARTPGTRHPHHNAAAATRCDDDTTTILKYPARSAHDPQRSVRKFLPKLVTTKGARS